jgi:ABC-type uncharacterized transport system involved in gliding motility auxiliary subunit
MSNQPNKTLDRLNLATGILALLGLGGSIALNQAPATMKIPPMLIQVVHSLGLLFMAVYVVSLVWLNREFVKDFMGKKQAKSGANILAQILAIIGIIGAANYFGSRHHSRVDLTENKSFSLSEQTQKVLKGLKEPLNVSLFVKAGDSSSEQAKNLWKEYAYYGGDKLKLDVIDIDKEPLKARQMEITSVGSTVLQRGDRKTTISGTQEQDLTSSILKVTQSGQKVVYFTLGHGELPIDKMDNNGLSYAKDALTKQNYKVDSLTLFSTKKVPSDAAVVILAGPVKPMQPVEIKALDEYLANKGRVVLAMQPRMGSQVNDNNLIALAKKYGIDIQDDVVLDQQMNAGALDAVASKTFGSSAITNSLQVAVFPGARSLKKVEPAPTGVTLTSLVDSGPNAWGETNLKDRNIAQGPTDHKGPLSLMMMAEKDKARFVVSGSALTFANVSYVNFSSGDLFLNTVNYLADEESLVSIPPKDSQPKSLTLLPEQYNLVFAVTVALIPLALLLLGAFVWWKRR